MGDESRLIGANEARPNIVSSCGCADTARALRSRAILTYPFPALFPASRIGTKLAQLDKLFLRDALEVAWAQPQLNQALGTHGSTWLGPP